MLPHDPTRKDRHGRGGKGSPDTRREPTETGKDRAGATKQKGTRTR